MVGADLYVLRSEAIRNVFERLPMTVVLSTSWRGCGTPMDIAEDVSSRLRRL